MEDRKTARADLENKKIIFREIGLITALIMVLLIFNLKTNNKQTTEFNFSSKTDVVEELVPVTVQKVKTPPPPPPVRTAKITIVENNTEVESDIEIDVDASQETVIKEYIPYVPVEPEEEEIVEDAPIFVVVESMPEFFGGMSELMKYLQENIRYPYLAKESGIQGRVFVTFVVETDGSVTDVKILRGIGGGCDEEAIRVVEHMPKWMPGKQRNVPVRVRFNLPIKFTLQ